jgi:hypothetical protein
VILYSFPVYLFALGLLLLFEPIFGVLPSPVFFHPGGLRGTALEPVALLRGDARAVDPGRRAVRSGGDAVRAGDDRG